MKAKFIIIATFVLGALYSGATLAQQRVLAADQNPRYMESQAKYARVADSLTTTQGTTIQDTYKAYDWYEARQERRQQNREWAHQERMNGYYDYSPSWGIYGGSYYSPFYNNYNYGRGWGRGAYRGGWGGRSHIGIGFGWYN
ncbi:hypothetical protein HQ865_03100 [Mucilaginibacter mali]|uniref:Uncharacterized protein n=1 Tax=Mucilaginibacter mali TaxID=2740462 RepID=A0A7D4Q167_9SPHI|nr:hypothetical protein [Mucilaginibacter mali]QKJ28787.1 hypothetical protein HQ865_03100 [Mucilaginibacter mali]